jgi:hypothetical protein
MHVYCLAPCFLRNKKKVVGARGETVLLEKPERLQVKSRRALAESRPGRNKKTTDKIAVCLRPTRYSNPTAERAEEFGARQKILNLEIILFFANRIEGFCDFQEK